MIGAAIPLEAIDLGQHLVKYRVAREPVGHLVKTDQVAKACQAGIVQARETPIRLHQMQRRDKRPAHPVVPKASTGSVSDTSQVKQRTQRVIVIGGRSLNRKAIGAERVLHEVVIASWTRNGAFDQLFVFEKETDRADRPGNPGLDIARSQIASSQGSYNCTEKVLFDEFAVVLGKGR